MKIDKKIKTLFALQILLSLGLILSQAVHVHFSKALVDNTIQMKTSTIVKDISYFVLAIVFCLVCEFFRKDNFGQLRKGLLLKLRVYASQGILYKDNKEYMKTNIQEYISVFNNDIDEIVDGYYINLSIIFFQVTSIFIYTVFLMNLNVYIALVITISNILTVLVPYIFSTRIQEKKMEHLESLKDYNVSLGDFIKGQLVIRTNRISKQFLKKLNNISKISAHKEMQFNRLGVYSSITTGTVSYLGYLLLFLLGIYMIRHQQLTYGGLLASIQVSDLLVGPSISLADQINSFNGTRKVKAEFDNNFKYTLEKEKQFKNNFHTIALDNVVYEYETGFHLKNINYIFSSNKKYLVCGENGSGKTTLFKLLLKIIEPHKGRIIVDGNELKSYSNEEYFDHIGVVLQEPFLFNDSLMNNITLFNQYPEEAIHKVINNLKLEHLKEDIYNNRNYHENMKNISGGEKQKICLARILLQNKRFVFMDEATASIDKKSSDEIERFILGVPNLCVVNIKHHLNKELISYYDEILYFQDGSISKIIKSKKEKEKFADEFNK